MESGGDIKAVKAKTRESRLLRKKSLGWRKKFIAIIFRKIFKKKNEMRIDSLLREFSRIND